MDLNEALKKHGFPTDLPRDGVRHRISLSDSNGCSAFFIAHSKNDKPIWAHFGDWRWPKENWITWKGTDFTEKEIHEVQQNYSHNKKRTQEEVAKACVEELKAVSKAPLTHEYLVSKKITDTYGIGVDSKGNLLIPIGDVQGKPWSIQSIQPNGFKPFKKGGRIEGNFYVIGNGGQLPKYGEAILVEGWGTGNTVHTATGKIVVVAFSVGNLWDVTEILTKTYPKLSLLNAVDNDQWPDANGEPKANAGLDMAKALFEEFHVPYILPKFKPTHASSRPTDFNDLMQLEGMEAVREQLSVENPSPWKPNLYSKVKKLPEFPQIKTVKWLDDFICAVRDATETPSMLAGLTGLGTLSACTAGSYEISINPVHNEPLNLWVCALLGSGNRKTAVIQLCTRPISDWQREKDIEMQPLIREAISRRKTEETRLKYMRTKLATKAKADEIKDLTDTIVRVETSMTEIPQARRVWASDVTPEKLGMLMAENNETFAILSDEGGILDMAGGRYSNGVPNMDGMLKAHAGSPDSVHRVGREPVHLERPTLTIVLCPQPSTLYDLEPDGPFRKKGFLARFLYAIPESNLGYRTGDGPPIPEHISARYSYVLKKLLDAPCTKPVHTETTPKEAPPNAIF